MARLDHSRAASLRIAAVCATVAAASCGHGHLVPAPRADVVGGAPGTAVAVKGGVRLVVTLDDWRGVARQMPDDLTPVKVRIVNRSGQPVSILNDRFWLKGRHGHRYRAVPAIPLDHEQLLSRMGPLKPMFAASSFSVAPRYHDIYPDLAAWPTPLLRDGGSQSAARARWHERPPGRELCRMALPEGVLGPDGELTGYLYFEDPTSAETELTLDAALVSGQDGSPVAELRIPLRVD